ncbi:MAG: ribonuclease J [Candidatus Pacebacteria bacterium]|nr:ribonuclease J [Candidatus Paceibacterota bacterium]
MKIETKKTNPPVKQVGSGRISPNKNRIRTYKQPDTKTSVKKTFPESKAKVIPKAINSENIRIITLGGVEEVGKNMTVIEYKDDILVFDCGIQFVDEDTPGIDFIIPNTKYLEENKDRIKAMIITHGHLDHIAAIPYIIHKIGNPPIYAGNIASLLIKKRMTEFPHLPEIDIKIVKPKEKFRLGNLGVKFFEVTHSIPDSMGISVETPYGNIVLSGDYKLEHVDEIPTEKEKENWGEIGKDNNLLFISDSTNAEKKGFSVSEKYIRGNIEEIIKNINGRIIVGAFASQFNRMIAIIEMAEKYNKKVILEGRSIKTNLEIAMRAGIFEPKKGTLIQAKDISAYPSDKILVLATGAQGEEFAALMRMSTKKHKYISLNNRDTVVLSSSIVPGNEISVQKLMDNLYRHDLKVIHYQISDIHSGGHGREGELKWAAKMVNAKYFMPAYGWHSMLKVHAEAIKSIGVKDKDIVIPDNGSIVEISDKGKKIQIIKEKAPSNITMVDGFSIGDIQEVVIRDRQNLAQDGIFVVIATIDTNTGKLRKSPDIISRGFIYLRESKDLLKQARYITKKTVETTIKGMKPINFDLVKKEVTDNISRYLFQTTKKKPIVIPVILGV